MEQDYRKWRPEDSIKELYKQGLNADQIRKLLLSSEVNRDKNELQQKSEARLP